MMKQSKILLLFTVRSLISLPKDILKTVDRPLCPIYGTMGVFYAF